MASAALGRIPPPGPASFISPSPRRAGFSSISIISTGYGPRVQWQHTPVSPDLPCHLHGPVVALPEISTDDGNVMNMWERIILVHPALSQQRRRGARKAGDAYGCPESAARRSFRLQPSVASTCPKTLFIAFVVRARHDLPAGKMAAVAPTSGKDISRRGSGSAMSEARRRTIQPPPPGRMMRSSPRRRRSTCEDHGHAVRDEEAVASRRRGAGGCGLL